MSPPWPRRSARPDRFAPRMTQLTDRPTQATLRDDAASTRGEFGSEHVRGRSPRIGARELVLLAAGACLLAAIMTWPLVLHLDRDIAQDLGDPIRTAWQVAWEGHALSTQPLAFFQSNAFWPLRDSLAFSDSLLGYTPAGLIGEGAVAALVRYNLLFLFAQALAFVGAYLLARELGAGRAGAAVAGAAFAYAPFRLAMNGHLHVISSGGIPLSLFLMLRGYRRERAWLALAGWLVVAWQLSLGFTLGLQIVYLVAALVVLALVVWWRRGRPAPPRRVLAATAAGMVAVLVVGVVQARPYLRVADAYANAQRSADQVRTYSPPLRGFLAAPPESIAWGRVTAPVRETLASTREASLFPGAAILALAAIGALAASSAYSRRWRIGLAAGTAFAAVLSLGFGLAGGWLGYRWLYELAPGWDAIRTPGRLTTLTSLGLALLAASGASALVRATARRRGAGSPRRDGEPPKARGRSSGAVVPTILGVALVAVVLLDGAGRIAHPTVPPVPAALMAQPGPQVHAPTDNTYDRLYMFWSTEGFPRIVNGTSTFSPRPLLRMRRAMGRFPDRRSLALLRSLGVRTVVVHPGLDRVPFPPSGREAVRGRSAEAIAARPLAGLPVRRERVGGALVYRLETPR